MQGGSFRGSSANLSGTGFSGMTFIAKASSEADFNAWVESVQSIQLFLTTVKWLSPANMILHAFYLAWQKANLFLTKS
jgi:heme/copper-type cytochrome/quinol oxidase subunit 2